MIDTFNIALNFVNKFDHFKAYKKSMGRNHQGMLMDVEHIRKIDKWLGIPLCRLLSMLYWLRTIFKPSLKTPVQPENILFVELSEMGSAIIAYSALQRTKELFPNSTLYFLIFNENRESVSITGAIDGGNILTIDCSSFSKFLFSTLSVLKHIRNIPIDTYIDMELFSRATSIISYLSGAHNRIGFYKFHMEGLYRGNFLTHKVSYNPHQHIAYNFFNLVYSLTAPTEEYPKLKKPVKDVPNVPRITSSDEEKKALFLKLQSINNDFSTNSKSVILNPNTGILPIRAWPIENYLELAIRLSEIDNLFIIIMGVGDALYDADKIYAAIPEKMIDLTNRTTLQEVITLFNICDVLVTNDSGPAHFASMTPITNIVFFGPETPALYGPIGENSIPLYANFGCSPCVSAFNHRKTTCQDNQCVKAITVDKVYGLVVKHL